MKKNKIGLVLLMSLVSLTGCDGNITPGGQDGEAVFRYVTSWDANLKNHFYSGTIAYPLSNFAVEGLYNRLDTTDKITPQLADGMPIHSEDKLTTEIKIKENAKWQNGDDFTAMDVVGYYYLNHSQITRYMKKVEAKEPKVVKITWNKDLLLPDAIKDKLISIDMHGTVNYNEFKYFVDKAMQIIENAPDETVNHTSLTAFGKKYSSSVQEEISANFRRYSEYNPSWYVATGAFKLTRFSVTQMELEKNPYHWAADKIKFDKVIAYTASDTNQIYNMLANGTIDYADGSAPIDTLDSIIAQNKNLIHLKLADVGTIGMVFNMEKSIWQNDKVREAFQYLFDRELIKNISNPYAKTQMNAITAMPESDRNALMSKEHRDLIKKYEYNPQKAESLLKEIGWKKEKGSWYDENGTKVKIYVGGCSSVAVWSAASDAVQAQLLDFGIEAVLKKTDIGTMYGVGTQKNSPYDCVITWTESNPTIRHAYGSLSTFNSAEAAVYAHLPVFHKGDILNTGSAAGEGMLDLNFKNLKDPDSIIGFSDYMDVLYTLEGDELENITSSIVVGLSEKMYGVNFFQNVTGSFLNTSTIGGIPLKSYWENQHNCAQVFDLSSQEAIDAASMNFFWSDTTKFVDGTLYPNR